jgi:hypothetical protein
MDSAPTSRGQFSPKKRGFLQCGSTKHRSLPLFAAAHAAPTVSFTEPAPVAASDIITRACADTLFANQSGYTAQVIKTCTPAPGIPESGTHGTTLSNGETMRLAR